MAVTDKISISTFADIPAACEHVNNLVLAAGVAESLTVPSGSDAVILNYSADCYVRVGGTAAVPAADITDGTGSMLAPSAMKGISGKTLSFCAGAACVVSAAFYKVAN